MTLKDKEEAGTMRNCFYSEDVKESVKNFLEYTDRKLKNLDEEEEKGELDEMACCQIRQAIYDDIIAFKKYFGDFN